jgi:hypothetical protein
MNPRAFACLGIGFAIVNAVTAFTHPATWHDASGWMIAAIFMASNAANAREASRLRTLLLRATGHQLPPLL